MRHLLERIAEAIRREPPTFKWLEQGTAFTELPPRKRDRELNEGRAPDRLDRRS